jgi:hypothetical protein
MNNYAEKLNATKEKYPFAKWRRSFAEYGLEQYTEENCNDAKAIFDTLIADLVALGEQASEEQKVALFQTAIEDLNALNEEVGEDLIETGEREELCELTDTIGRACGLNPQKYGDGEGLASEWREW